MDIYELGQSKIGIVNEKKPQVKLDLQLKRNNYCNNALIYGYINDFCGKPVQGAIISFINKESKEIGSAYSSDEGFYAYYDVKLKSIIRIIVKKYDYRNSISDFFFICSKVLNYNVSLQKSVMINKSIISGHIFDGKHNPIENIPVYLLKKCSCSKKNIYKFTNSNIYGQFVFAYIPKGNYEICINDSKYNNYSKWIEIIGMDEIVNVDIKLFKRNLKTKIEGYIQYENGEPIPHAVVILFKVEENGKLDPVKHTVCDEWGKYSFNNIPYANYIVKAKL